MLPTRRIRGALGATPIALVVLALAAVAGAAARTAPGIAAAAPLAAGCSHAAPAGSSTLELSIGGHRRTVIVHVPTRYRDTMPVALVLNMHGSGSTAAQQELFSGMDATADAEDFIVTYPQALITSGSGFDWNVPGEPLFGGAAVPTGAADDVAFLTDLVPALAARYCIDEHRVFATGVSGGGRMASQLGCDASAVFAAVAPVAGLRYPDRVPRTRRCR